METGLSEHPHASRGVGLPSALPRDIRLLSLDVFDTALVRNTSQPDHVFCLTQQRLAEQGITIHNFAQIRRQAEHLSRQTAQHAHMREETTLDEIYRHIGSMTGLPGKLLETAKHAEIAAEKESVRADPAILDLYRQARRAGIPVVFVSEMYLPEAVIARMLSEQGYDGHVDLFVSSTSFQTKTMGSLFTSVLELFELAPGRVLHIGDDAHADGTVPAGLGMRTWLYGHQRHLMHKARPLQPAALPLSRLKAAHWDCAAAADAQAMMAFIGKTYGSIIHGAFVRWIVETVRANGVDLLLFFSRDGFILKKIYDLFKARTGGLPPSAYCCVSRYALKSARMVHFDDADYEFLLSGWQPKPVSQILRRCGLRLLPEKEAEVLAAHGLHAGDIMLPYEGEVRERVYHVLRALELPLRTIAAHQRVSLDGYLRRFNLNRFKRVAVIDLGWGGNLQCGFEEALGRLGYGGGVMGLFFGLVGAVSAHRARGHTMMAFLPEYGTGAWDSLLPNTIPLLELLHSAPHGGVNGYACRQDNFRPCFAGNPIEQRQYAGKLAVYQEAVLGKLAGRTLADADFSLEACREALTDLCLHPSTYEAEILGGLVHFDGFEHYGDGVPIAPAVASDAGPGHIREAFAKAYWKTGFLARNREAAHLACLDGLEGVPDDTPCNVPQAGPGERCDADRALAPGASAPRTMLFVVHVMDRSGSPLLLLHFLSWLKLHTDIGIRILALNGGELCSRFEAIAPVLLFFGSALSQARDKEDEVRILREFCGSGLELVYLNSAFSAVIHETLARLGVPLLAHVHELENVLRAHIPQGTLDFIAGHPACSVVAAQTMKNNLVANHAMAPERIAVVPYFTEPTVAVCSPECKATLRRRLGMPEDAVVVLGCGAIEWRKGPDHFIDVARRVRDAGFDRVFFYWVGKQLPGGLHLEGYLVERGLDDRVFFVGAKDNYKEYFQAGDIFLLTSREEPFSLASLEACECAMAVAYFTGGGLSEFMTDEVGCAIEPGDAAAMAETVIALIEEPQRRSAFGQAARTRMLATRTTERVAPYLFAACLDSSRRPLP